MAHDEQRWLTPRLLKAATLCNQTPVKSDSPLWLGVDLGTCDVVSMVVDSDGQPVAVCLDWADVVRDGGFQPLLLDPIDFHGLFMQQAQAMQAGAAGDVVVGQA